MSYRSPLFIFIFVLFGAISSLNATAQGAWGSIVLPPDPSTFGPMNVGHMTFDAVDTNRDGRTLLVDVWYPVDQEFAVTEFYIPHLDQTFPYPLSQYPLFGPFGIDADIAHDPVLHEGVEYWGVSNQQWRRLIVFSHGYGGTNTQSTLLMETLASHGYIVVSPEHTGNTAQGETTDPGDVAAANRVPDISFIIDTMMARNADPTDAFFHRIYPFGVGVIGHSFGGTTSLGTAAGFAGANPDPRVDAIFPISAVVTNSFTEEQLNSISIPTFLLGGTEDTSVPIENNAFAFDMITAGQPVYRADVVGAGHTHFANVCAIGFWLLDNGFAMDNWPQLGAGALIGPFNATCSEEAFPIGEALRLQNLYAVSFFKLHLNYASYYAYYLNASHAQVNEPDVIFDAKNTLDDGSLWMQLFGL